MRGDTMKITIQRTKKEPRPREPVTEISKDEAPSKIFYQIERPTGMHSKIIKRGKISKKKDFMFWNKRAFFTNHILKEDIGGHKPKYRYFIRWNEYYSEALPNAENTMPDYSTELENIDLADMATQLKKALGHIGGFVFDRPMIILMGMAMVFGMPIGLMLNTFYPIVPSTIVHWVR